MCVCVRACTRLVLCYFTNHSRKKISFFLSFLSHTGAKQKGTLHIMTFSLSGMSCTSHLVLSSHEFHIRVGARDPERFPMEPPEKVDRECSGLGSRVTGLAYAVSGVCAHLGGKQTLWNQTSMMEKSVLTVGAASLLSGLPGVLKKGAEVRTMASLWSDQDSISA